MEINEKKYEEYVEQVTLTHSLIRNMAATFLAGGIICTLGQFALNFMMNNMSMDQEIVAAWTLLELILLNTLLTGFNIYPKAIEFGRAGALIPIAGFANSMVVPTIELYSEGEVFGVGCKILTIAGPVILYGVLTSRVPGLIYWTGRMLGVFQTRMDWEIFPGPPFLFGNIQLIFYGSSNILC